MNTVSDERKALREIVEAHEAPFPSNSAGMAAQDAWASRRTNSIKEARALLALKPEQAQGDPVAEVVWYEPQIDRFPRRDGHKIIDASMAFLDTVQLGTKLYTHPAPVAQVPEGWKLVPIEPTPKMVDSTWSENLDLIESHNTRNKRIYSAMIAAAPKPQEPKPPFVSVFSIVEPQEPAQPSSVQADWKHLHKYGYAPGGYQMTCPKCQEIVFDVDKRATSCRPCAEKLDGVQAVEQAVMAEKYGQS